MNKTKTLKNDKIEAFIKLLTVFSSLMVGEDFRFMPLNFNLGVLKLSLWAAVAGSDNDNVTKF
jgi:hypothetical protein